MAADTQQTDLLGLQTFALSEAANDIVNSLMSAYARLSHSESKKTEPDHLLIEGWHNKSIDVQRTYLNLNWNDFSSIEDFIQIAATEWHKLIALEKQRI